MVRVKEYKRFEDIAWRVKGLLERKDVREGEVGKSWVGFISNVNQLGEVLDFMGFLLMDFE